MTPNDIIFTTKITNTVPKLILFLTPYYKRKLIFNITYYFNPYNRYLYVICEFTRLNWIFIFVKKLKCYAVTVTTKLPMLIYAFIIAIKGLFIKLSYVCNHTVYHFTNITILKTQDIYFYNHLRNFVSQKFRRVYENFYEYVDTWGVVLMKQIIPIIIEKFDTFVDYQIFMEPSFTQHRGLFTYIKEHTIRLHKLFYSMRVDIYMFSENKQIPRRYNLFFQRIESFTLDGINVIFRKLLKAYLMYHDDDTYDIETKNFNICFRFYLSQKSISTEALVIEPFMYYDRRSILQPLKSLYPFREKNKNSLLVEKPSLKTKRSTLLAEQTFMSTIDQPYFIN